MDWQLHADIYYGVEFDDPGAKYGITIRLADQELEFTPEKAEKGVWKWF